MLVVEAKLKNGTPEQYQRLDEAIRTSQFVRNSCVRYCMDHKGTTRNDLQKLCSVLANNKETPWVNKLNSQARQSAADRAWQSGCVRVRSGQRPRQSRSSTRPAMAT